MSAGWIASTGEQESTLEEAAGVEKFDSNNPCPKCGLYGASTTYHEHEVASFNNCASEEHLHRTCKVCEYEWSEEPLNAG